MDRPWGRMYFCAMLLAAGGVSSTRRRSPTGERAAIYTRFSTREQNSTGDQVRTCLEYARKLGLWVDPELIFSDEAKSGQMSDRDNFQRMLEALRRNEFDVIIFFSTSRLFRKQWKALEFIDTEILPRKKRCIFLSQGIDTAEDKRRWRMYMNHCAQNDEYVTEMNTAAIRASHIGKLRRGEVVGEMTFGYCGEETAGIPTRRGRPARRFVIAEDCAQCVRDVFRWFVIEWMPYHEIAARLRREGSPKPRRASQWSCRAVKGLLQNRRYIGDFSYSRSENEYHDKGVRKVWRDKPLYDISLPELRIVSDELFHQAQARIASMPGAGGRRPGRLAVDDDRPRHPLSRYLQCPYHTEGWLWLTDGHIHCRRCFYERERRVLFSMVRKDVALQAICRNVAREIVRRAPLVERAVEMALATATANAQPNRREVERHSAEIERLTSLIGYNRSHPGATEEEQVESGKVLDRLQQQRRSAQSSLAAAEAAMAAPRKLPTSEELRSIFKDLERVLTHAAASQEPDDVQRITIILRQLIDAPIKVSQEGEMVKQRGWLRIHFDLHLERLVEGVTLPEVQPVSMSVDMVPPSTGMGREAEIMERYRAGLPMKAIARKLKIPYDRIRRIVRNQLKNDGVTIADVRARQRLPRGMTSGGKHLLLAERIMESYRGGKLYGEIADELKIDIHRVSDVIRAWHRERGLDIPDGRNRRKVLSIKNRSRHDVPAA